MSRSSLELVFVGRAFTARQAPREGAPYINSSELRSTVRNTLMLTMALSKWPLQSGPCSSGYMRVGPVMASSCLSSGNECIIPCIHFGPDCPAFS
jgi:hypothetical protein